MSAIPCPHGHYTTVGMADGDNSCLDCGAVFRRTKDIQNSSTAPKHADAIRALRGLFKHEECYTGKPCDFDMGIHTAISELEGDGEPDTRICGAPRFAGGTGSICYQPKGHRPPHIFECDPRMEGADDIESIKQFEQEIGGSYEIVAQTPGVK